MKLSSIKKETCLSPFNANALGGILAKFLLRELLHFKGEITAAVKSVLSVLVFLCIFFRAEYFLSDHTLEADDTLIFSPHLSNKHARMTMQGCPVD